jgi:DNA recombination protein RmuC
LAVLILQILALRKQAPPPLDLTPLHARTEAIERAQERTERGLREELGRSREEASGESRGLRQEVLTAIQQMRTDLDQKLEAVRGTVEERLKLLQDDNALKLEQIRRTVDEQLQTTLEKRLGESFKIVSERLEQVHRGLGEMQTLAAGVGDLKKLLSNVRTRGTWGEVQLGLLLEQMLTPDQYGANVATTGTNERVEFAIKLPGAEPGNCVWLPIDAKFPKEDYERLLEAVERSDAAAIEEAARQLETRARQCARSIAHKYVEPPKTTDFAIMYLATEGLYAEVLRRPGLVEALQRDHRVTVAGPMTLAAILNSLQMGFRTLAIQHRSSEVWEVLGTVKTEFSTYSDILTRVQKKLQEATNTVETGLTRTRAIQRKLKDVQQLPVAGAETPPATEIEDLELKSLGAGGVIE